MVLMAIDHVRVYSGLPAGGPTPGIFFTRWVTHFCAPAFIFLAGTSAYLYGRRHTDLPRFLLVRGLWLVLLELTYFRVCWTFNLEFRQYELAGVIWVIGWCMVLMSGLVRLPLRVVAAIGLAIVAGHNLFDAQLQRDLGCRPDLESLADLLRRLLRRPRPSRTNGPNLMVLYSIVPWIGVMAAGLRLRQHRDEAGRRATPPVPPDRRRGGGAVPRAEDLQPVRRSEPLVAIGAGCQRRSHSCRPRNIRRRSTSCS